MKFALSDQFKGDWGRLSEPHRRIYRRRMPAFNEGCERYRDTLQLSSWPDSLRVGHMTDRPGVFEMTWSFSGPDGRATFEFTTLDGDMAVYWRRIGSHRIYKDP